MEDMKNNSKLLEIQAELKAPKDLLNKFGGYNYRSCESILEALKPLLLKHGVTLFLTDEIVQVGSRNYVKATAHFIDGDLETRVTAFAREEETKKGMDGSQITGAASSYARKYALNALFLIDDAKDSDATNDGSNHEEKPKDRMAEIREKVAEKVPAAAAARSSVMKSFTGKVAKHFVPKGNSPFHSFLISGHDGEYLSTKDEDVIETMINHGKLKDTVEVQFEEQVNGKYTNRYIVAIMPVEEGAETKVPF